MTVRWWSCGMAMVVGGGSIRRRACVNMLGNHVTVGCGSLGSVVDWLCWAMSIAVVAVNMRLRGGAMTLMAMAVQLWSIILVAMIRFLVRL